MKKLTLAFVALMLFTLGSITADGEEMLINGDFETVDDSVGLIHGIRLYDLGPDGWDVYESIPGWRTTAGNGIEVQYDFAVGAAHSASRKVELDSHPADGSNSSMTQTVYLVAGSYELTYFYRARTSTKDDNRIDVFLDLESAGFPPANKIMTSNSSDPGLGWVEQKKGIHIPISQAGSYNLTFAAGGIENTWGGLLDDISLSLCEIELEIEIKPETLNLNSKGLFTAFIDLPEGYGEEDIDISTVTCEGAPAVDATMANDNRLIVKFDREYLVGVSPGDAVKLTVTGQLTTGTPFTGSDTIRVIDKGKK